MNRLHSYRLLLLVGIALLFIATTYRTLSSHQQFENTISQSLSSSLGQSAPEDRSPPVPKGALPEHNIIKPAKDLFKKASSLTDSVTQDDTKTKEGTKWAAESRPVANLLQEGAIPGNVHYMWCGRQWFEYREYLSVVSALRVLNPDKVVIHHEFDFEIDKMYYHLWIDDLKHDYPFLILEKMDDTLSKFCSGSRDTKIDIILAILDVEGGFYISSNTWMLDMPPENRMADMEFVLDDTEVDGYVMIRKSLRRSRNLQQLLHGKTSKSRVSRCAFAHHMLHNEMKEGCIIVRGPPYDHFYPMDIWERDDAFGRLARRIFYGTEEIRKPKPNYDELVPNIGHMVWIGGGKMDFVFFLSLLSMLYVVNVDVVYIHGDVPPTGPNWERVQSTPAIKGRVKFVTRTPPYSIYQGEIEPYYRALMSDIIRVDLMIKYGGVYTDTDAIWVKGLTEEDRAYDAVASFDWVDWSWPYPDSVNFGLSYGKKNAPFWRIFRDSMRILHNEHHGFTGVMMPYKLLEKYPELLKIDRHLQVICYQYRCHPIWVKDYHNMSRDHITDGSLDNWREDVNAFHWTHPNPPEYANETTLRKATGMFADVGRFVLEKAGLW